jgi:hypothetical protein
MNTTRRTLQYKTGTLLTVGVICCSQCQAAMVLPISTKFKRTIPRCANQDSFYWPRTALAMNFEDPRVSEMAI